MAVLVVEDDPGIGKVIQDAFAAAGRPVRLSTTGEEGLELAAGASFDAIVLDVLLPVYSGFEVCQRLREQGVTTPILMLTCRDRNEDVVRGLRLGADEYMTKPFSTVLLTARVDALIRRANGFVHSAPIRCGEIVLDPTRRQVTLPSGEVELTAREFDLLHYFIQNPGRAVTRETLLANVWGDDDHHTLNVVDVYVSYLRRKLSLSRAERYLRTVRGYGYIFSPPD
ncbi:MAG: response regulator transcription factor [Kiloniellales bacterium]|nr:response regulator transcription factor [Kiloniellales bacterium]